MTTSRKVYASDCTIRVQKTVHGSAITGGEVIPAGVGGFFDGGFRKERRGQKNVPCGTFNHNLKIFRGVKKSPLNHLKFRLCHLISINKKFFGL